MDANGPRIFANDYGQYQPTLLGETPRCLRSEAFAGIILKKGPCFAGPNEHMELLELLS